MNIVATTLADVKLIEPNLFCDPRGSFSETFREDLFRQHVGDYRFVQDNQSTSEKNVLRGLHYQLVRPQGKLVRCIGGEIFDVAVDMRRSSATFGHWVGHILSAHNRLQMWIPPGFAHGFCVLTETADVVYKCTDYYHPQSEQTIIWNDPDIGISWPLDNPVLSAKDRSGSLLRDAVPFP